MNIRSKLLLGGTAIALGLLNPLAALIPLIETGSGKDSDCTTLLQQVDGPRREAEKPPTRQKSKAPRSAAVSKKPGT